MQSFYDFETIKGWHGKHHCRITPVCKDNYSTIKERVELALASQRADRIIREEAEEIKNITNLKKFVRENNEFFRYSPTFKSVDIGGGKRAYCMLDPIG